MDIPRQVEVKAGRSPVVLEAACPYCGVRAGVLAQPGKPGDSCLNLTPTDVFHNDPVCATFAGTPANDVMRALVDSGGLVPKRGNG